MKANLIKILGVVAALAVGALGGQVIDPSPAQTVLYKYDCSQVPPIKPAAKPAAEEPVAAPAVEEPAPAPAGE